MTGATYEDTLCFTPVASDAVPVARVRCGRSRCAQLLNSARTAVRVGRKSVVYNAPLAVEEAVRMHASALYSSESTVDLRPVGDPLLPLEGAMLLVNAGLLAAGAAGHELVTEENCSRCIEEWWCGHLLLMAAVGSGGIAGQPIFKADADFWFEQVYLPAKYLVEGEQNLNIVKNCVQRAREAGVIETRTAILERI